MVMDQQLASQLYHVYGDYIYDPEFMGYLETLPALFRMYEFSEVNNFYFQRFLLGIPKLIYAMGQGTIN